MSKSLPTQRDLPPRLRSWLDPGVPWPPARRRRLLCWHEWRDHRGHKIPDVRIGFDADDDQQVWCRKCGKTRRIQWRPGSIY